jgi:phage repressor protein C with HTH and peptisase S24 domain
MFLFCTFQLQTRNFEQNFQRLVYPINIFISHHPKQLAKANELEKFLSPMVDNMSLRLSYWGNILPGEEINEVTYDNILKAQLILVLVTPDYLCDCKEELGWIKNTNCFEKNAIIPVPLGSSLWRDTFLGNLMPLPRNQHFESSPFDDSARWEGVAKGIKEFLANRQLQLEMPLEMLLARANGAMYEPSQEIIEEIDTSWKEKIGPNDKVFKVVGNSMKPSFQHGDELLATLVNIQEEPHKEKQVYVVRTQHQEYLVKRIGNLTNKSLFLISENELYDSLEIPLSEVISVYKVKESRKIRSEFF